jgi:hypothetical protein
MDSVQADKSAEFFEALRETIIKRCSGCKEQTEHSYSYGKHYVWYECERCHALTTEHRPG